MKIESLSGAVMATSVYAGSTQIGVNVAITLPEVTQATSEVTAAGGVINLPVPTKIDAMEVTISKQGLDKAWLATVKPATPFDLIANIVVQKMETDGSSSPSHIKAYLRVISGTVPSLAATYGETLESELAFSVLSYKLVVDGTTYLHVDPVKGLFSVSGTNYAEKITAML